MSNHHKSELDVLRIFFQLLDLFLHFFPLKEVRIRSSSQTSFVMLLDQLLAFIHEVL